MSKKMLIEATHPEETRVVVVDDGRLEELDVETSTKKQIKGNIYLAKVVRVEPSLQAAFVEYGGNRHGFLSFSEIHPDYYQIPAEDLERLKKEMSQAETEQPENGQVKENRRSSEVETISEMDPDEMYQPHRVSLRKYRIQDVIHHGQIMLVQVVKEERGNKGAAMTTYLSLAGRYSVLMPKNGHSGGVSRKIADVEDRKRLKKIVEGLPVLEGQSVIIRTAGKERTKAEIKRDFDYLSKTWEDIVEKTMTSIAPALIHEEGNLIKRTLRDGLTEDVDEVLIEGEDAYKNAKAFLKLLMPRWVKKLKEYNKDIPLFQAFNIERQMEEMNQKNVYLKSGGYLVIDQTEALVAIDVNSGRATRERNIEETALKTNLEAAEEVARQLRLRDLAGLIVIDFIDMEEPKNNYALERKMKEALKRDRARVQMGKITGFGLMEISRQRLRSSLLETSHHVCPMCQGTGVVRSLPSCAMHALHILESAAQQHQNSQVVMTIPVDIALYVLNNKRINLAQIEERFSVQIRVEGDASMLSPVDYRMEYQTLPQKEKKGFFARAISNLLPAKKVETEKSGDIRQEDQEVVMKKEDQKEAQKEVQSTFKSDFSKSKRRHEKNRRRNKKYQQAEVNEIAENTVSSEVLDVPVEENFKVVEQENLSDVLSDVTENTAEKVEETSKKNTSQKQTRKKGETKKHEKKTQKKVSQHPAEKKKSDEITETVSEKITDATVPVEKIVEPEPVTTVSEPSVAEKSEVTSEETTAPKTGWWNQ